jgi:hypothetical protein
MAIMPLVQSLMYSEAHFEPDTDEMEETVYV